MRAVFEEGAELVATAGVAEFPERLGLDLADAFAGHGKVLADFFEGMLAAVLDRKSVV